MKRRHDMVLAVHPNAQGLTFTLFEAPLSVLDWGTKRIKSAEKNVASLEIVRRIVDRYQPDILVLEDCAGTSARKSQRMRRLHQLLRNYADSEALETHAFSRTDIRTCFSAAGAKSRFEIAVAIAARVHALRSKMPTARTKPWEKEDERLVLFDAASLALTYYCRAKALDQVAPPIDE